MKAVRQSVQQKAADELAVGELHRLGLAVLTVVFPAKADLAVVQRDQPAVGNRNAMCVTGEIAEDLLRACERALRIDHPFGLAQRSKISREGTRLRQPGQVGEERKLARSECRVEILQKQSPE